MKNLFPKNEFKLLCKLEQILLNVAHTIQIMILYSVQLFAVLGVYFEF